MSNGFTLVHYMIRSLCLNCATTPTTWPKGKLLNRVLCTYEAHPQLAKPRIRRLQNAKAANHCIGYGRSVCQFYICGSVPIQTRLRLIRATSQFDILDTCDAVSICVPTSLRKTGAPDISNILGVVDAIAEHLDPGMIVVLESTTYPGTTTEVVCRAFIKRQRIWNWGRTFPCVFRLNALIPGVGTGLQRIRQR